MLVSWVVALGLGIALLSGTAVAGADTGSAGADTGASASSDAGDSDADSGGTDHEKSTKATKRDERTEDVPSGKQDDEGDASPAPDQASADEDGVTQPAPADDNGSDPADPGSVPPVEETTEPSTEPAIEPAATGREDGGSTPRAGPLSLVTDSPSAQTASPGAAAAEAENSWWDNLVREFTYTFFNKAPTLSPTDVTETEPGVITGKLNGKSNNGFALSYIVKTAPTLGTLTIDQEAGTYTYRYTPSEFDEDTKDSFVITADNGTQARQTGLVGVVQFVMHNLAIGLGLAQRDTTESNFSVYFDTDDKKVNIDGTGFYGDRANSKYWAEQNYADNCMLMSILMMQGQLTGVLPTRALEDAIIEEAKVTPSVADPSKKMYIGGDNEDGVLPVDAAQLLKIHGYNATLKYFPTEGPATYNAGLDALDQLSALLVRGGAAMVGVNNQTIWDATEKEGSPGANRTEFNHGVVVIAIDTHNGKIYLNDPGVTRGKGLEVPLGAFMWAWAADKYQTIMVEKPVAPSQAAPESAAELALAA